MSAVIEYRNQEVALPKYDDMCRAIAECHRVDEVKDIRDKAEALRAYARMAHNREAEIQFSEIKILAERQAGQLLQDMAENGTRAESGKTNQHSGGDKLSLADIGVTAKESERFQAIAAVPQDQIDAAFAHGRETQTPVTSAQIRNLTKQPDFTPTQRAEHERLWRVLRAIEQISEQDIGPEDWLDALPPYMVERVRTHLIRARPWLEEFFNQWDKANAN